MLLPKRGVMLNVRITAKRGIYCEINRSARRQYMPLSARELYGVMWPDYDRGAVGDITG